MRKKKIHEYLFNTILFKCLAAVPLDKLKWVKLNKRKIFKKFSGI